MSDVEMVLTNEGGQWRVIHFPDSYTEERLKRMNKDALVAKVLQLNTNGKALEEACRSQEQTIEGLNNDLRIKNLELREEIDKRQEWVERTGLLQEAATQLIKVMADDLDDD